MERKLQKLAKKEQLINPPNKMAKTGKVLEVKSRFKEL